jgi:pimeloyl-ACP methyl ester carboxylesterase
MKKTLRAILVLLIVLVVVYFAGPSPERPAYVGNMSEPLPVPPQTGQALETAVRQKESGLRLKPDNEARIIWNNDSLKAPTPYAIVYLHGFSASQEEGDPVHMNTAKAFGCNLYLARLSQHGLDTTEQLAALTPDNYWQSAREALAIGKKLGNKVILMATSTGGSLALMLAAAYPTDVAGLVLLSPNVAIKDPAANLLNNPWGLQIARMVKGSKYNDSKDQRDIYKKYWNSHYRLEGAVALQEMLETSMRPETFKKVTQPVLMLYYYKDEAQQDAVVSVAAMKQMFEQLGTPPDLKRERAMPNTGDHVIGSYIKSKDVAGVERETRAFLQEVMQLSSNL